VAENGDEEEEEEKEGDSDPKEELLGHVLISMGLLEGISYSSTIWSIRSRPRPVPSREKIRRKVNDIKKSMTHP